MSTDTAPTGDAQPIDFDSDEDNEEEEFDDEVPLVFPPPQLQDHRLGTLGELWSIRKRRNKRKKMAKKGYVEWYLVNSTFPRARFIKPKLRGGGVPDYKHDGNRYVFPRNAAVPNEQSGMWTFIHREGEIDPINVRDSVEHAIAPDQLQEYLDTSLASSAPGFWSKFDFDVMTLLWYAIIGLVIVAIGDAVLSGGMLG